MVVILVILPGRNLKKNMAQNKQQQLKYSYSKLNTFENCPFKFHLQYEEGHFVASESLANQFGVLIHYCEETIARTLQMGKEVDYEKLKKDFIELNIPKKDKFDTDGGIFGINELKKKYQGDYFSVDDYGMSYHTKAEYYLNEGIYRLEKYLKEHPTYEIYGMEQFFKIAFGNYTLSGYIDRIFHDTATNKYIIEDIKTKSHRFKDEECITPLQFVLYADALKSMVGIKDDQIICQYDLPFCKEKQPAGTTGFIKRGMKKIEELFTKIESGDRAAHSSPLCYWCCFSATNPNQPEEGKHLCPYYSLWTPNHRTFEVKNQWEGLDKHDLILKRFNNDGSEDYLKAFDFDF